MKNLLYSLLCLSLAFYGCSEDEPAPTNDQSETPDPLEVTQIMGTIWNGQGAEGIDLLTNETSSVYTNSSFSVTFSKSVKSDWLQNESLPRLLLLDGGEPVSGVGLQLEVLTSTEIILTPTEELTNGATYQIVINEGYEAEDGGVLEATVTAEFTILTPDPLTITSVVASNSTTDVSLDNQTAAANVPVDAALTVTFSGTVFLSDANKEKIVFELIVNDVADSQVAIELTEDFINKTVKVTPAANLSAGATYRLTLKEGITYDLGGMLEADYTATFTTEN